MAAALLLLGACGGAAAEPRSQYDATLEYGILDAASRTPVDFDAEVRPILEHRCVVCHGCYDAPCQLKLSAHAGIARGASKEIVYDGARITAADPTRLFIDALTTPEWRAKGFYPVLGEGADTPAERLRRSVMYRMLRLKRLHPQPLTGMLGAHVDTSLDRKAKCPTLEEFDDYENDRPDQGMPFAVPDLTAQEYETLVRWLALGAAPPPTSIAGLPPQVETWEAFLNGNTPKERLVSRYLYEHLFAANLHFADDDPRKFYTLVRSSTPPGQPVVPIATRRPYGAPQSAVFYRLRALEGSVVAKNHVPYELSGARLERLRELFFTPEYAVTSLPGYEVETASNPFSTFAELPSSARYRFLLDDARFFVEGFIKGPVCRGQIALNVIEDRFWIFFIDPDAPVATNSKYIAELAADLSQPTEMEDNLRLVTTYGRYLERENRYLEARREAFRRSEPLPLARAVQLLWNGGQRNPNAALTVFRHYDSASIAFGLVGEEPMTAWVLDYPAFERIHYLLVAGFDVYGNLGHQYNTRRHMDILRMEAENTFLAFLPAQTRKATHDAWYTGIREGQVEDFDAWWMNIEFVSGYQTAKPQHELYQRAAEWLGPIAQHPGSRPCAGEGCATAARAEAVASVDRAMAQLGHMRGKIVGFLPDVAFVRVKMGGAPEADLAYSLISDKAYENVSSMFAEEKVGERRDASGDRQTVVPWLEGSYPQFFFVVDVSEAQSFADRYDTLEDRADYERFVDDFGIRRTNTQFWPTSDWFNGQALREEPERGGILDLNRYQNR
jgi:hypothetical protein